MTRTPLLALPLALAACDAPAPAPVPRATPTVMPTATPGPTPTTRAASHYVGRWIGVEGMFVDIVPRDAGGVTMTMQWDLDHKGVFPATVTGEGLRFTRGGIAESAVPGDGDDTGLKWLAGKKDCLIVRPGEGYCRD